MVPLLPQVSGFHGMRDVVGDREIDALQHAILVEPHMKGVASCIEGLCCR